MSAINALTYAILLPTTLQGINNYTLPRWLFCAQHIETYAASNETDSEATSCQIKESSAYWWPKRRRGWDDLIRAQLQSYLGLNESHSFGHACPISSQEVCLGVHVHVRSGDVFRGNYDDVSGHWIPGEVHPGYEQPPLEYYLQAVRRFLDRHKGERKEDQGNNDDELNTLKKISVKVACEDNNNPVCEIFETMAHANPILEIVRADLLATLQTITCCEEIVLSRSTLSTVMTFSPRLRHLHHYTNNHSCSSESPRTYDVSSYFAVATTSQLPGATLKLSVIE